MVLLGAELTHCLSLYRWGTHDQTRLSVGMGDAIDVLLVLDEAAARGEAPTTVDLAGRRRRWLEPQLEDLLGKLRELHWVHMTREGGWALARRMSDATLLDLYASRVFELPREDDPDWPVDTALAALLKRANTGVGEVLRVPLADFRLTRAESVAIRASADQSTTSTSM